MSKQIQFNTTPIKTDSGTVFNLQDCASTAVSSYAYKPDTHEMAVLFKNDESVLYIYQGVPVNTAQALETAPSKGSYIMREIKAKHEFRKELIVTKGEES